MKILITILLHLSLLSLAAEPETPSHQSGDEYSKFRKAIDLTDEQSLSARVKISHGLVHIGKCELEKGFSGEFLFAKRPPSVGYQRVGDQGQLSIRMSDGSKKNKNSDDDVDIDFDSDMDIDLDDIDENELYLNFTGRVPLDLDMEMGVVKGEWMLGGMQIENCSIAAAVSQTVIDFKGGNRSEMRELSIENGVGKLKMYHLADANFANFSFEAGVGSYLLEFSGKLQQSADVDIEIGMGKLKLFLPRNTPVRIEVDKSFLSSVDIYDVHKRGDTYTNDAWEDSNGSQPNLDILIETGVASIEIEWLND